MVTSESGVTFVAATALEANALRRHANGMSVIECGIALSRLNLENAGGAIISCGLAGGLREDLPTGTIVVPNEVQAPDGTLIRCDDELVERLQSAVRRLGHEPMVAPLLTSPSLVTGSQRSVWAAKGFAAVDMETGLLRANRLAAVRVILDTPKREISPDWLQPARALLRPSNWPQLMMLAREAPRCADLAARVAAAAFQHA